MYEGASKQVKIDTASARTQRDMGELKTTCRRKQEVAKIDGNAAGNVQSGGLKGGKIVNMREFRYWQ